VFSTAEDNQKRGGPSRVFQGEPKWRPTTNSSASSIWSESRRAPRGVPQVEVTSTSTGQRIVNVSAKDKRLRKSSKSASSIGRTVRGRHRKMVKDAEAHAEEDKTRKAAVEAQEPWAEALVLPPRRRSASTVRSRRGRARSAIENAMADLKEALKGDDAA